jgi:hypothetical protein
MILFSCSCGLRHGFFHPCNGVIDINSVDYGEVEEAVAAAYEKDVKEEKDYGWTDPTSPV